MKKFAKILAFLLSLYILASAAITTAYHLAPYPSRIPWGIATHRNGLLIFDFDNSGLYLLNPLSNYGDDWIVLLER